MEIVFNRLKKTDYKGFCDDVCEIFSIAVIETFGKPEDGKDIISSNEILEIVLDPGCETYAVYADGVGASLWIYTIVYTERSST